MSNDFWIGWAIGFGCCALGVIIALPIMMKRIVRNVFGSDRQSGRIR